jgi:hypothetical protein
LIRTADPQKRGVKGYFTGSRLEFLDSYRDEYALLRGKNRAKFWHKFYEEWWRTYPWRLPDNEDPPADDPQKMAVLSSVGVDREKKGEVEKKLQEVSLLHFPVLRVKFRLIDSVTSPTEDLHVVQLPSCSSKFPPRRWSLVPGPQALPRAG